MGGGTPYEEPEHWLAFFQQIAERIVNDFSPQTVLDAGCAMGYLVAALRDRGVEAYGLDISEYALSKVREDIKPFYAVGSLTESLPESLPKHFDLIITIEVLEHLYAEDGRKAIENLCSLTDRIIFSSTPEDFSERTHVNVQQREYWARLFAEQGFYDDINYRPTYITYHASSFKRSDNWLRQIEDYERNIRQTENSMRVSESNFQKIIEEKDKHIQNQNSLLEEAARQREDLIEAHEEELARYKEQYEERYRQAINQQASLRHSLNEIQNAYSVIENAFFWKITKPLRVLMDLKKKIPPIRLFVKGLKHLKRYGLRSTLRKIKTKIFYRPKTLYTKQELEAQRHEVFPKEIKFSFITSLYNTPKKFLREMIESVLAQTYGNWELCLADGSDNKHAYVRKICEAYAKKDKRILYQKLEKNLGVSGNSNACLDMATGDYIAILDHDDVLNAAALYEMMHAICDKDADFAYTDEKTFRYSPDDNTNVPHFKPDYAPDSLLGCNYICHFTTFKRELLDQTGRFDSACDGAQDHDLFLRLTEKAKNIVHIPKVLYYWRAHPSSVAQDVNSKPYVFEAIIRTGEKYLERHGLDGEVSLVKPGLTLLRVRYAIKGTPKVSILIPNYEHIEDLQKCLDSIFEKTTYSNYEVIIIENNSSSRKIFEYYSRLEQEHENVRVVKWPGKWNYPAINNFGFQYCTGEYILLLNNDTEVITPEWLEEMLMFAQRPDIGAVGAMLYYPNDTVQHAGVIIGVEGIAVHAFKHFRRGQDGYFGRMFYAQNLSVVTGACMMIRRSVWEQVGGLDEAFKVALNDVDICMRIRKAGYLIVWTPFCELYHYESKSRGYEDTPEKQKRWEGECRLFKSRWCKELAAGDPYYNPNLTLDRPDFSPR